MTQISAANNLVIEMDTTRWRLLLDGHDDSVFATDANVLVEAVSGDALRYQALFGEKHHLPDGGVITPEQIQRVVLGWSSSDNAWHLGMMLSQEIALTRGSRWCELARWSETDAGQPGGAATQAGTSLAFTLQRPFNLVPPKAGVNGAGFSLSDTGASRPMVSVSQQATTEVAFGVVEDTTSRAAAPHLAQTAASAPVTPETVRSLAVAEPTRPVSAYSGETYTPEQPYEAPLVEEKPKRKRVLPFPQAPFRTGLWTLERDPNGVLQYRRSSSWVWTRLGRAVWYAFWAVVYVFLAYATLNSTLALPNAGTMLPNPEILPYLGIGSAVLLAVLVLYILIDTVFSPGLLVIDPYTRTIRMQRGDQTVWSKNASDLESVYVSHMVELKHKKRKGVQEPIWNVQHGELNLHLGDKKFKCFLRVEETEELVVDDYIADIYDEDSVRLLEVEGVATPMQGAAMTIAQALVVPCYYDHRTK
jgi:hypothetical protein